MIESVPGGQSRLFKKVNVKEERFSQKSLIVLILKWQKLLNQIFSDIDIIKMEMEQ